MIALILGGAPSVFREAAEAQALLNRRHLVVATNHAGARFAGRIDALATLHADLLPHWRGERVGNADWTAYTPDTVPERWPGSSGLYAAQVALFEMGATAAILCGVPLAQTEGHFAYDGPWAGGTDYRPAFRRALPEIGARTRSMGGWTADLFGKPTAEWVDAIDTARPLGATRPSEASTTMFHVKNTSETTQKFWARNEAGLSKLVRLEPGKAGDFDIDPNQPRFAKGGPFSVSAPRKAADPAPKADKA